MYHCPQSRETLFFLWFFVAVVAVVLLIFVGFVFILMWKLQRGVRMIHCLLLLFTNYIA